MDRIKIHIFHTGKVRVDRAIPLHEKNPLAVLGRGQGKQMILPVSAYLIEHPRGRVLIDAGWDSRYAHERPRQLWGLVDRVSGPILKADEGIDRKLAAIGLRPEDIDGVYFSHMDFDHVSGRRLVKNARQILTSDEEWRACRRFGFRYVDVWTGVCPVKTFTYEDTGFGPVGRSYDVFGDRSVRLVHTPGHSRGMFCVWIQGRDGYWVLGSDAAYLPESFDERRIPGFVVNARQAKASLEWLIQCENDPACRGVYVNHDPTVPEQQWEVDL